MRRTSSTSLWAAALVAAALIVPSVSRATTFSNAPSDTISTFGAPDTTSYGQWFTLPTAQALVDWTFYPASGTAGNIKFVVANWNGSRPVGPALYSVDYAYAGGAAAMAFTNINVNLAAGNYVAYITVANASNPASGVTMRSSSTDGGLGGNFRFLNSNGVDPLTLPYDWSSFSQQHLQFTANLGAGAANTLEQNIACAKDLINHLGPMDVSGPAQRNLMSGMLNNVVAYRTTYRSLALGLVNSALVRTDGCALRASPDTVINQGGSGMDFVTTCVAQGPIYQCLKDAQMQLSQP